MRIERARVFLLLRFEPDDSHKDLTKSGRRSKGQSDKGTGFGEEKMEADRGAE